MKSKWKRLHRTQARSSSTWTPAVCPWWLRRWLMSCWTRTRFVPVIATACWELSSWDAGDAKHSHFDTFSPRRYYNVTYSCFVLCFVFSTLSVSLNLDLRLLPLEIYKCRPFLSARRYIPETFPIYLYPSFISWSHTHHFAVVSAERQLRQHGGLDCPLGWVHAWDAQFFVRSAGADVAEGACFCWLVLLGALDFLQKPVVAFVRLKDSMVMESALESPIPVRFVFVLVGPSQGDMDYRETGRAMGALMADWVRRKKRERQLLGHNSLVQGVQMSCFFVLQQVFCLEAYLAQTDKEVTNAIADFMDCSIVIPPTEIQDTEMLKPVINYQKRMLRDRLRPTDSRLAYGDRVKG